MDRRVAIVTGGGRGLGRAITEDLAQHGVVVALAGRSPAPLEETARHLRSQGWTAVSMPTDVSDEASVSELFRTCLHKLGRLDILINNAGVTVDKRLTDLSEQDWQTIFEINVKGMFLCARAAAQHFMSVGGGRAVNVASVFGLLGRPGFSAYCASKGAVINFTRAAAAEWARFGAQINAVAPGYFATDINAGFRDDAQALRKVLRRIPARRMGEAQELANVVTYLALHAPAFLTGQTIAVDGGESSV